MQRFLKIDITKVVRDYLLNSPSTIYKIPQFEFDTIIEKKTWRNGETYFYQRNDKIQFLTQGYHFGNHIKDIPIYSDYWYLLEYRSGNEENDHSVNGSTAWLTFTKVLYNRYTGEEIAEIISKYSYDQMPYIMHFTYFNLNQVQNEILEFDNCYYFDLNKAYAFYLSEMFPKIKDWIQKGYKKNKERFKKIVNYSVGMMARFNEWLEVRNWIVNKVSERVCECIAKCDGEDIYVNTDGLIVRNPKNMISTSNELGDFKLVPVDDKKVWLYWHNGDGVTYQVMQYFENGIKQIKSLGNFRHEDCLINLTDLSIGKVPIYVFKNLKGVQVVDEEAIEWVENEKMTKI